MAALEKYRYQAWHEQLSNCYYVVVKLYKYGRFGFRYPVASRIGRSSAEAGIAGVHREQERLKSEMLKALGLRVP